MRFEMKKLIRMLATVSFVFGLVVGPYTALAHSQKEDTAPKDGEILSVAPDVISMTFNKPMRITQFKLLDTRGNKLAIENLSGKTASKAFQAKPKALPAGHYTVKWRALSSDGHPMKGTFSFSVK